MITVFFHIELKPGSEERFRGIAEQMTRVTRAEDAGCISYVFHQKKGRPLEYVLYEQWQDEPAVDRHLENMCRLIGPARPGTKFPAPLYELIDKAWPVFYDVVA